MFPMAYEPGAIEAALAASLLLPTAGGALLVGGAREVKVHGEWVPVNASVVHLEGFSGHADQGELLQWLQGFQQPPSQTFVVHGEPDAADTLRAVIKDKLGWAARVPAYGEIAEV